jgi:hypothetical protein
MLRPGIVDRVTRTIVARGTADVVVVRADLFAAVDAMLRPGIVDRITRTAVMRWTADVVTR